MLMNICECIGMDISFFDFLNWSFLNCLWPVSVTQNGKQAPSIWVDRCYPFTLKEVFNIVENCQIQKPILKLCINTVEFSIIKQNWTLSSLILISISNLFFRIQLAEVRMWTFEIKEPLHKSYFFVSGVVSVLNNADDSSRLHRVPAGTVSVSCSLLNISTSQGYFLAGTSVPSKILFDCVLRL